MSARIHPSVAVAIAIALVVLVASTPSASAAQRDQPKATVVLVHGAWADSSSWAAVVRRLQRAGYKVAAPGNPLRGLGSDAAYLRSYLGTIDGPVVLAGHSYGGAVITNAAADNANVKALVYANAYLPDQGEDVVHLTGARPGSALGGDPAAVFEFAPYPGAPAGDLELYVKPKLFARAFANDLSRPVGRVLAASQRAVTLGALTEPSGPPAWRTIPSWSVVGTLDRVIPLAQQNAMSQRAGSRITKLKAGHLSPISRPRVVARVITRAARATD
jgi:pimeloyl-ACP methyl ester carboxylesterase